MNHSVFSAARVLRAVRRFACVACTKGFRVGQKFLLVDLGSEREFLGVVYKEGVRIAICVECYTNPKASSSRAGLGGLG